MADEDETEIEGDGEEIEARALSGCAFRVHDADKRVGFLRIDTDGGEPQYVAVTKDTLQQFAEQCAKYAGDLEAVQ